MLKEAGGEIVLSVRAEMPIVSEEYWEHFVSFRFPSLKAMQDLYRSDAFQEVNVHRIEGLNGTLAVLGNPQKRLGAFVLSAKRYKIVLKCTHPEIWESLSSVPFYKMERFDMD